MTHLNRLKRTLLACLTMLLPFFVYPQGLSSSKLPVKVYKINIQEEIGPGISRQVSKALKRASGRKADRVLIHMNTYGGILDAADSIRTLLLNCTTPTIVFIDNNAASAGALIAISCEKIYMRKGASIGAATVVNQNAEPLPDKYQSYMRSMMRSTAEARGRDPKIAEAMVDPRIFIKDVNDSGKVLTLTSNEAMKNGYCNGIAETIPEVLKQEGIENYSIEEFEPSWVDKIIGFLIHPAVSGVLILVMLGGLYFELQHPGIGFPIIAAVLAALMYFAPLYLEGLAANWEVLISAIGIILIVLEIFVLPGFGVPGIAGIVLLLFGLTTSMLNNQGLDFTGVSTQQSFGALAVVLMSMVGALVLFIATSRMFSSSPVFKKLVLKESMHSSKGFSVIKLTDVQIGDHGITSSLLRPSGKVEVNGKAYQATADSGFIDAGKNVEIVAVQSSMVVVREI